jgi:lipoprotein-anchoring transpeptidase ErfK/SrfK
LHEKHTRQQIGPDAQVSGCFDLAESDSLRHQKASVGLGGHGTLDSFDYGSVEKRVRRMRKSIFLSLGAALAFAFVATAQAAPKAYWDPGTGKIVKYDNGRIIDANRRGRIKRQDIVYDGPHGPNTIIVNTSERRLYYVYEKGKALKYGIGVGRAGFEWSGTHRITRKAEWPGWTPPPEMIARERAKGRILPAYMEGGIKNPLGARALYIGSTLYRIHGTAEPWTIGRAVSSGCIRLTNDDVTDLYDRVKVGAKVVVLSE